MRVFSGVLLAIVAVVVVAVSLSGGSKGGSLRDVNAALPPLEEAMVSYQSLHPPTNVADPAAWQTWTRDAGAKLDSIRSAYENWSTKLEAALDDGRVKAREVLGARRLDSAWATWIRTQGELVEQTSVCMAQSPTVDPKPCLTSMLAQYGQSWKAAADELNSARA
jgi:hypothetical protein